MAVRMRFKAVTLACLAAGALGVAAQQQFAPAVHEPLRAFLSDANEEALRGTYLFYTQNYRDKHKRNVVLHGSVYGVLHDVHVNGCDVEASVLIIDLYSGTIRDVPTGDMQDKTEYAIRFKLTRDLAAGLDVTEGRPTQLGHAMHTLCQEESACTFTWLRIRSAQSSLHEQIMLNNSITFDGPATLVMAPVSSREAGQGLVRELQALAGAQCK